MMGADPASCLVLAVFFALAGTIAPLALVRRPAAAHRVGHGLAAIASACAAAGAVWRLLVPAPVEATLFPLPVLGDFAVRLDALGAIFLLLIGAVGLAVSIYALGYAASYIGKKPVGPLAAGLNLFLLAMGLVVAAANAPTFLFTWELMAVVSLGLVAFEHEREVVRRAAVRYAIMTHLGTGCLIAGFALLAGHAGSTDFAAMHAAAPTLAPALASLVFVLGVVGFGAKAGIVPIHGWLPEAHPAAPGHVSALMSGVMIKTGLYGLIRLSFDLLGGNAPSWWGVLVLALGGLSAVLGALYAAVEPDLKRLLAFSSVENMGIMWLGVGSALVFRSLEQPELAALGLVAALAHALNHGAFKGLLFCGAGSVVHATHTSSLEALGGLIRRMPRTAALFLVGAGAIAALPGLNGFIGEWLTFHALIEGVLANGFWIKLTFPLAACALALAGGLALLAFTKAFAVTFLARARSEAAAHVAHDASAPELVGMALLAGACAVLGVLPFVALQPLGAVTSDLFGLRLSTMQALELAPRSAALGSLAPVPVALVLVVLLLGTLALPLALGAPRGVRRVNTWGCGLGLTSRTQYSASAFAQPIRAVFGRLLLPHVQAVSPEAGSAPYFRRKVFYAVKIEPVFDRFFYDPVARGALGLSRRFTRLQTGSIHLYLAFIFVALIVVLFSIKGVHA